MSGDETLVFAAGSGKLARVRELLHAGTPVEEPDDGGTTALYGAALAGHTEIVEELLAAGADPNRISLGDSDGLPLCAAACWGHEETVSALLEGGADPNLTESGGWTPLLWASAGGHTATVILLLDHVADPDAESRTTPLWLAADRGAVDAVRALLTHGADPARSDDQGSTPLEAALRWAGVDIEAELRAAKEELYPEPGYEFAVIREEQDDETELITVEARRPGREYGTTSEKQTGHGAIATILERALGLGTSFEGLVERALEFRDPRPTAGPDHRDVTLRPAWWETVRTLQTRGDTETYDKAVGLCASPDVLTRMLGVEVLSQLGRTGERPFAARSLPLLLRMTREESDPRLLRSLIISLSHHGDSAALPEVLKHARHPDSRVRDAVAFSLMSVLPPGDGLGAAELIRLTGDDHEYVRDWATMSLSLLETDTAEIRNALATRLDDDSLVVAAEAARGLAERGDPRAAHGIRRILSDPDIDNYPLDLALEAAADLGDPGLREILGEARELCEAHGLGAELDQALARSALNPPG
ncbi:MAG: ankyrin repeat domain-containing protein [Streptosporangiaceae bacterium]